MGKFKPGQSGNLKGRPKVPQEIKHLRQMVTNDVLQIIFNCFQMTQEELIKKAKNPDVTSLELLILSTIQKGIIYGDHKRLQALLDYFVPKESNKHEVSIPAPKVRLNLIRDKDITCKQSTPSAV